MGILIRSASKTITAQNTYSSAVVMRRGYFEFALYGTWDATVVVEKRYGGNSNWFRSGTTFTGNGVWIGDNQVDDCEVRFGVPTGSFTSGTVYGHLAQTFTQDRP